MLEIKLNDNHILKIKDNDGYMDSESLNGDICFLVYKHREFQVDVEGFKPLEIYNYLNYRERPIFEDYKDSMSYEDFEDVLQDWGDSRPTDFSDYYIWTVYAYIHSGVSLSLTRGSDQWDTSSTGFVLLHKGHYENEEMALSEAETFINYWNNYLIGNCFWFELIKQEECGLCKHIHEIIIDSCGGFIGDDEYSCGIFDQIDNELIPEEIKKLIKF